MTPERYAVLIARLGLSQVSAADFLGINPRTSRRYVSGELAVPKVVAMLLELMVKTKSDRARVEKLA
jgi:hypothetical protein